MVLRFWLELISSIISLCSLLIFGEKGIVALALLALVPIIYRLKKIKPDERETQLFFRGTQYIVNAMIAIIILSVFVFKIHITDLISLHKLALYYMLITILIVVSTFRLFLYYRQ